MKKNVSSQVVGAQMVSATDGSAFTGSVTVAVTGDAGTQATGSVGSGACTHEGNGFHTYAPAQAETNYDHVAFTFIGTGAVPATVQIYTSFPQTGDSFARVGAPVGASISADVAAVKTQTAAIETDTQDIQARIPAALVSGRIDASVGAMAANVLTATAINADAFTAAKFAADVTTEFQSGLATAAALATVDGIVDDILVDTAEIGAAGAGLTAINLPDQTMNITGNITGNLSGSVGSVTGAVGSVTGNVGGNVTGTIGGLTAAALKDFFDTDSTTTYASAVAGSVVKEIADNAGGSALTEAGIADAVWDEVLAGHAGAGSAGEALSAAGTAGDPWTTALPGAYGAGTAGKIIGDNINATISSRATQTSVDTIDGIVDSILVDTAEIGAAGAGLTNINLPNQTMDIVGNITGNLSGSVGSVTAAVTLPTIPVNWLTASGLAADAVTEIQSGLATSSALTTVSGKIDTVDDFLDTEIAAIKAKTDNLPSDPADASVVAGLIAAVEAKVDTVDDFLDTEVAAIKAKTDQLTFGVTGKVDANITHVNEAEVTGNGESGTEWGPA
jgi:hypothetical protein